MTLPPNQSLERTASRHTFQMIKTVSVTATLVRWRSLSLVSLDVWLNLYALLLLSVYCFVLE